MNDQSELLCKRIHSAFADNRYPGDGNLTVYGFAGRDHDETFKLLQGRDWKAMPVAEFMQGDTPFPDLTPAAFHYYMPALLIGTLNEWPDLCSALAVYFAPSTLVNLAKAHGDASFAEWLPERIVLFTPEQRTVMADVLHESVQRGWLDNDDVSEAVGFLTNSGPMSNHVHS